MALTEHKKQIAMKIAEKFGDVTLESVVFNNGDNVDSAFTFEAFVEGLLDSMPKPDPVGAIKELGKRLAARLDEDDWNYIEPFLRECEAPITQPASEPSEQKPECPYPCGWENLYSLIVSNGALIVRSVDPDSVSESTWTALSNTIEHAKELCKHGMLPSAAPQPDYKAQLKDLREQVECSTITRDNMEGRLNIATVKLAAMKQQRDALLGLIERIGEDGNYHLLGSGIRVQIFDAIASVKGGA